MNGDRRANISEHGRMAEKALQESGRKEVAKRMKLGFRSVIWHEGEIYYIMPDGSRKPVREVDQQ